MIRAIDDGINGIIRTGSIRGLRSRGIMIVLMVRSRSGRTLLNERRPRCREGLGYELKLLRIHGDGSVEKAD